MTSAAAAAVPAAAVSSPVQLTASLRPGHLDHTVAPPKICCGAPDARLKQPRDLVERQNLAHYWQLMVLKADLVRCGGREYMTGNRFRLDPPLLRFLGLVRALVLVDTISFTALTLL